MLIRYFFPSCLPVIDNFLDQEIRKFLFAIPRVPEIRDFEQRSLRVNKLPHGLDINWN